MGTAGRSALKTVMTPRAWPTRSGLRTSVKPMTVVIASVRTALMAAGGMSQQHSTLAQLQHASAKQTCRPAR